MKNKNSIYFGISLSKLFSKEIKNYNNQVIINQVTTLVKTT